MHNPYLFLIERNYYDYYTSNYTNSATDWSFADLALQPKMGLLGKWYFGFIVGPAPACPALQFDITTNNISTSIGKLVYAYFR
jgi:hypothetical protein